MLQNFNMSSYSGHLDDKLAKITKRVTTTTAEKQSSVIYYNMILFSHMEQDLEGLKHSK